MAVICKNNTGAVIDHLTYINDIYNKAKTSSTVSPIQFNADFFKLYAPFMMDSQFEKFKLKLTERLTDLLPGYSNNSDSESLLVKRKKRKRKFDEMSETEKCSVKNHKQVCDILEIALKQLLTMAESCSYFSHCRVPPKDNNLCARVAAKLVDEGQDFVGLSQKADKLELHSQIPLDIHLVKEDDMKIFNRFILHNEDHVCMKKIFGCDYLLPPKCSFLMSDISHLEPLISEGTKYDLIVLDPPWYNKSVRRKEKYQMLYDEDLFEIPLASLANPGCLVVVWATNNQQQHKFIQHKLFPRHHIQYITKWFWLKVTRHGQTVSELQNAHKKPYETLFIGCIQDRQLTQDHVTSEVTDCDHMTLPNCVGVRSGSQSSPSKFKDIPDNYVLISIPSSVHSHKPPLGDVLKSYIPERAHCLELFARHLLPGWVSWGNEVLRLQHRSLYVDPDVQ